MKVYLDNAATTPLDPKVFEAMLPVLKDGFGKKTIIIFLDSPIFFEE